jgi:hypothetical protein
VSGLGHGLPTYGARVRGDGHKRITSARYIIALLIFDTYFNIGTQETRNMNRMERHG